MAVRHISVLKAQVCVAALSALYLSACVISGETLNNYYNYCQPGDEQCVEQKIIEACTRTASQYPYSRDRLLADEYAALMTADAVFQIEGGPKLVGREAISNALRERGADREVRHFSQVVRMTVTAEDRAEGLSYVTVWGVDAQSFAEGKNTVRQPVVIAEYHDQFRVEAAACRISNRLVKIIFEGASD